MLIDGVNVLDTAVIKNLTVDSGNSFPVDDNIGELFLELILQTMVCILILELIGLNCD